MFGYITPLVSELSLESIDTFKSYYCGLCFSLKKKYGNLLRLSLNYDATFFAIFIDALNKDSSKTHTSSCIKHPFGKKQIKDINKAIDYSTDLNFCLINYKLLDNILDDNDVKSSLLYNIVKLYKKKITYPFLDTLIKDNLNKLHLLEESHSFFSLDEICHPFSDIIGKVLELSPINIIEDSEDIRNSLYKFGYYIGKVIYLFDAIDDIKDDIKDNSFNPFIKIYDLDITNYDEKINSLKESLDLSIITLLSDCNNILEDLPLVKNEYLIKNIVSESLIDKYMNISSKL